LDSLRSTPEEPTGRHDGPAFTLRWIFERADLQDAVMRQPAFRRQNRQGRWLLLAAPFACVLFAFRPTWLNGGLLAGLLLGALALKAAPLLTASQQLRGNPQLHGEIEATVSAVGVRVHVPGAATEYAWEAFRRVVETDRAFLLSFALNAKGPFLVLPKRALTGQADVAALRDLLDRMIRGS
jgi:hypothetical protein